MSSKTNELLNYIIQAASQAIVADDEVVKRHVMADIVYAIASVIPCDHSSVGADVLVSPHRSAHVRTMTSTLSVIAKTVVGNRRFYAEAEWSSPYGENKAYGEGFVANVYQETEDTDQRRICRIEFAPRGSVAVARMLRGRMRGVASHFGANARKKANRRAKKL